MDTQHESSARPLASVDVTQPAAGVRSLQQAAAAVRANVGRVIVGKESTIDLLLVALLGEGHALIEDVPGLGKTVMAKALTGVSYFSQKASEFEFRPGPIFASVVLADEINRATPRTQSALLEAMQERQVTVDGNTRLLPQPFLLIATQNPIELEGTFPLPEAQLDRFLIRLRISYPSFEEEQAMLYRFKVEQPLETLSAVVSAAELLALLPVVRSVHVSKAVAEYLLKIVRATREHPAAELGASPRAALALFRAAQALAAMRGREYVKPDDVKQLAVPVLAHRLLVTAQSRLRGQDAERVIQDVINRTPVPVENVSIEGR
jgi:MoxR-like ATPase